MFLRKLKIYWNGLRGKRPLLSVIIPFSSKEPIRKRNFKWVLKYWMNELPNAEFIIGHTSSMPFCKGEAINEGIRKSKGHVICVLDADAFMNSPFVIRYCAEQIMEELKEGRHFWYVPYRELIKLSEEATEKLVKRNPRTHPLLFLSADDIDPTMSFKYGNRYAAMVIVFPRAAYDKIHNLDERFVGWGGEDVSLLKALDTLWGKHKTVDTTVYHLWHPTIGRNYKDRMWVGQVELEANNKLAVRYHKANRAPKEMQQLIEESKFYYDVTHPEKKDRWNR